MSINRVNKRIKNFSVIDNQAPHDNSLSWEARGLLWYLLTKPDGWTISTRDLIRQSPNAKDKAVANILKELAENGYLIRWCETSDRGTFVWQSEIFETKEDAQAWAEENKVRLEKGFKVSGSTVPPLSVDGQSSSSSAKRISTVPPLSVYASSVYASSVDAGGRYIISTDSNQILNLKKTEFSNESRPTQKPEILEAELLEEFQETAEEELEILKAIKEAESTTPIAAEILEEPKPTSVAIQKRPEERAPLISGKRKKNRGLTQEQAQAYRDAWNEGRPVHWPTASKLTPERVDIVLGYVDSLGGFEAALATLQGALKFAREDIWCQGVRLSFENAHTNSKLIGWAEKSIAPSRPLTEREQVQAKRDHEGKIWAETETPFRAARRERREQEAERDRVIALARVQQHRAQVIQSYIDDIKLGRTWTPKPPEVLEWEKEHGRSIVPDSVQA